MGDRGYIERVQRCVLQFSLVLTLFTGGSVRTDKFRSVPQESSISDQLQIAASVQHSVQ
ncbi:rCG26232 [Rattus norvegicus]|uniref:RCG26232 n=1 Tax=Rattus norvegicus TaxID=10116 RepID=A6HMG1_RAT|nr:rCG26232 [Rattus norvegicus]